MQEPARGTTAPPGRGQADIGQTQFPSLLPVARDLVVLGFTGVLGPEELVEHGSMGLSLVPGGAEWMSRHDLKKKISEPAPVLAGGQIGMVVFARNALFHEGCTFA